MADLKSGSTVGGSPIWTQGNLNIQPAGDTLFYKGHKVYTAFDKPDALDFDSVSASQGGTFLKSVHFEEGLSVGSASGGETKKNGIFKGKGDSASFDGVSWSLNSWHSIGFVNSRDDSIVAFIDTTSGDFKTKGVLEGSTVKDSGQRVYSPSNKPTNNDLNLVSRSGDVVQGTYTFNSSTINFSLDTTLNFVDGDTSHPLIIFSDNNIKLGNHEDTLNLISKNEPILIVNGQQSTVYHTHNKPTKNDVGLGNVTDDAQVKRSGDIIEGTITAPKLLVTTDPESPNELVRLSFLQKYGITSSTDKVTPESDWNTLKANGIYSVDSADGSLNAPEDHYYSGILTVYKSDSTDGSKTRIVQVYYPYSDKYPQCWRSCTNDVWSRWNYIEHIKLADKRYVNVSGDIMAGVLTVPMDKGIQTSVSQYNGDNYSGALGSLDGSVMLHRLSDNKAEEKLGITHDSRLVFVQATEETQTSVERLVYHEGHKPTSVDVGAVPLNATIDFGTF